MKLRTSFFNPTVFKKDLTRFAPTWALYTVGLFMLLSVCMSTEYAYRQAGNLLELLGFMAVVNLGYGLLSAQLLFGDLFNSRHVNALHAMPLRRECWFVTHTVSGLLFSFGPNLVMSLVAALIMKGGWIAAGLWLLAATMQYLFFFGLAVLSALCVGNRFAMVLVYGIVNFLSLIAYWFYYAIYEPLLYGVYCSQDLFTRFCPVWTMGDTGYELVTVAKNHGALRISDFTLGDGWGYLAICAAMGIVLLGLALMLYRRRKLESAGDFMAVTSLEPVFLGLYTLSVAVFFQMFADLFGQSEYIFLGLGIVVGFFTGLMLVKRTIRVFRPRSIIACVLVGVAFAGSMVLTKIDPMGVTRYVPKAEQVEAVYLDNWHNDPEAIFVDRPGFDAPEDVAQALLLHQAILDGKGEKESDYHTGICLTYKMKNGAVIQRYYPSVAADSEAGALAASFLSNTAFILGGDPDEVLKHLENVHIYDYEGSHYGDLPGWMGQGLLKAIIDDCEAGRMAQHAGYRPEGVEEIAMIDFEWMNEEGHWLYKNVSVFSNSFYTIRYLEGTVSPWLAQNGYN